MLIILSPAKTLDFDSPPVLVKSSKAAHLKDAAILVERARQLAPESLVNLMGISQKLAELNHQRFQNWSPPFNKANAKQAIYAFQGDVYTGLQAESLTAKQMDYAQEHLRILSGLYGLLRPLDLMQAYRLEMGTSLDNPRGDNLYQFWGDSLAKALNKQAKVLGSDVLINLASKEYFSALPVKALNAKVITPVFKDYKNGKYKIISFFAKKARGQMANYIIRKGLKTPAAIKRFDVDGYRYDEDSSTASDWVFLRDAQA